MRELGNRVCFLRSPEICVEVLSPRNTQAEITEKMALYFDAGAKEVWLCNENGMMSFFSRATSHLLSASELCPELPKQVEAR
jgi:Uma2 family endonuclease